MKAFVFPAEFSDFNSLMGSGVVPDHNDGAAKVSQQIAEEVANLNLADVSFVEAVIEPLSFLYGAY